MYSEDNMIEDQDIIEDPPLPNENLGLWIIIGAIALATAVAIWMVPDDGIGVEQAEDVQIEPITRLPTPTDDATEPPGSRARAFIKQLRANTDIGQAAYDEAVKQSAEGQLTDAYLLYFFAARQGHAAAALELGSQADPAHFNSETSSLDGPDIVQAHKWYQRAMKSGSSEAETRLIKLHDYTALQAGRGDAEAERLLLQWK
jgi:TPR repeat protein